MTNPVISFFTMGAEEFGQWLRERRKKQYLTVEALAKQAGISKQYLSILERAAVQALTGKPAKPTIGVVDRIAQALGISIDEARLAAGYAPKYPVGTPETIRDLARVLDKLGIGVPVEAYLMVTDRLQQKGVIRFPVRATKRRVVSAKFAEAV